MLKVQGIYCDLITEYSNTAPGIGDGLAVAKEWEPQDAMGTDYPTGGDLLDAFLSAIAHGDLTPRYSSSNPPYPRISEIRHAFLSGKEATEVDAQNKSIHDYFIDVRQFATGRRLLYTQEGYIGIVSSNTQPGDVI